jgi:hypothetical protein
MLSAPGPVHTPLQLTSRPVEGMEAFVKVSSLGRPGQPSKIVFPLRVQRQRSTLDKFCTHIL